MNRPLILVLIGVNLAASQCWYADLTDADSAKKLDEADKKRCQEKVGRSKEGCEIKVTCQEGTDRSPGYYFEEDYWGDGYKMRCRSGGWIGSDGRSVPICKRGCTALVDAAMANATYHNNPPNRFYTNGNNKLWPLGTVIETQCKAGYYFQVSTTHQAKGYDEHKCSGGSGSGWEDLNKDPKETGYAWPAYCRGYCDPILNSSVPNGVDIIQDPTQMPNVPRNNNKTVLPVGAQYVLKCKEGYKPVDPRYKDGRQQLSCDGNWRDSTTGKQPADLIQCIADGCPAITSANLPTNGVLEEGTGCAGEAKADGCRVTIKCSKGDGTSENTVGYYMPGKPSGYELVCNKGTWYDVQNNVPAQTDSQGKYPGTCEPGCIGLTRNEEFFTIIVNNPSYTGHKNDDVTVYPIGTQITTSCKDGYVRPGMKIQGDVTFLCEAITGWKVTIDDLKGKKVYPGSCVVACPIPPDTPGTTSTIIGEQYTKNGTRWVQHGATMTRQCRPDFISGNGQPSPQTVICEGGDSSWRDPNTNKSNVVPLQCIQEGSPGCTEVTVGSSVNVTYSGNCTKVDGLIPKGCIVGVRCQDGYYPDGDFTVTETGWQNVSCKAGKDGYEDISTGSKNVTLMRCIQACEYPDTLVGAAYVERAPQQDVFPKRYAEKLYIKPGSSVTTTCMNLTQGYYWNNEADKNRVEEQKLITFVHVCQGGPQKYTKQYNNRERVMPDTMCGPTCLALSNSITTFVDNTYKDGSITFWTDGKQYAVAVEYRAECRPGFEYPRGSPEANRGYQRLLCVGSSLVYKDLDTNATNAQVTQCQKAPEPRCPAIDQETQKVDFSAVSGDCTLQSGTIAVGCVTNVQCKNGYFPQSTYTGRLDTSKLQCKKLENNTAIWVDFDSGTVVPALTCVRGCPVYPLNGSARIIQDANRISVAGVEYYPVESDVTVACNPGYIASGDYTPETTGLAFRCVASNPDRPWMNKKTNSFERGPFLVCVKYCDALGDSVGQYQVTVNRGPNERRFEGRSIVLAEGTYELKCQEQYTYRPKRPNDLQVLICDGATGQYMDINNGGANISNINIDTIQRCVRENGDGCAALQMSNAQITNENSCNVGNVRYPQGCSVQVTCKDGYATTDSRYNGTGKQQLNCKGYDWYDEFGNKVNQSMVCTAACKVEVASKVSKIVNNTAIVIMIGETQYIPAGGQLVVRCQGDGKLGPGGISVVNCRPGIPNVLQKSSRRINPTDPGKIKTISFCPIGYAHALVDCKKSEKGYKSNRRCGDFLGKIDIESGNCVIWRDDSSKTNSDITYTCNGDTENVWSLVNGSSKVTIPGDGCISTCLPMTIPNDVSISVQKPTVITYQGQELVANGAKYFFTCASGYERPAGAATTEEAMCNGATRKYVNPATNADFNGPSKCQPKVTGCTTLVYDTTKITVDIFSECTQTQGFWNSECKMGYRCKSGFHPDVTDFNTKYGYRNLTCKSQRGQYTWRDESNREVTGAPLNCIDGCVNETITNNTKPDVSTKVFNQNCPIGPRTATCFEPDQYAKQNITLKNHYYACPVDGTFYNNYCDGACRQIQVLYPEEVVADPVACQLDKALDYVFGDTYYDFKCRPGYVFRDEIYRNNGYQRLYCETATSTYTDKTAGKQNYTTVARCDLKQGCPELSKGDRVNGPTQSNNLCTRPTATNFAEGCELRYSCITGTYPVTVIDLYEGIQTIGCQSSSSWNYATGIRKGQPATKIVECVPGCVTIDKPKVIEILNAVQITVNNRAFQATNPAFTDTLTCFDVNTRTSTQTILANMTRTSLQYFCDRSKNQNQLKIDDRELCDPSCPALSTTNANGLTIKRPALFNPYGTGDLFKSGAAYEFSCESGYDLQYPSGTTITGSVKFTCQDNGNVVNLVNNQPFNPSYPPLCVQKPQCTKPEDPNVEVNYDQATCSQNSATSGVEGCKMTAKCRNGTYPEDPQQQSQPTFNYQCMTNVNQPLAWRNISNPSQTYKVNCVEGCMNISLETISRFNITVSDIETKEVYATLYCSNFALPPEETKQYYCPGETSGIYKDSNYKCTETCMLPKPAAGITVTAHQHSKLMTDAFFGFAISRKWSPIPLLIAPGTTTIFTCPSGQMFVGTGTNTRKLTCGTGTENTVMRDENGQRVYELETCS